MRCLLKIALPAFVLAVNIACVAALAQTPDYSNIARTPTPEEIQAWDISISLDGKELPPGSGTAKEGAAIFAKKCAGCHGQNQQGIRGNEESPLGPPLVGGKGTLTFAHPVRTLGSFWPYATPIWDYINRSMPKGQEGSLHPEEIYSLVAFLLFRNDIIKESDVIDAKTLPKVQMPNRDGFLPNKIEDLKDFRKRGCRVGQCPELSTSGSKR